MLLLSLINNFCQRGQQNLNVLLSLSNMSTSCSNVISSIADNNNIAVG